MSMTERGIHVSIVTNFIEPLNTKLENLAKIEGKHMFYDG
jgi:hypothetical protein